MVIDYLYFEGVALLPLETDPPLFIDADTVLARAITAKHLKAIGRWDSQLLQPDGAVQHAQFAEGHLLDVVR